MGGNDWVNVRLSAAGELCAAGAPLRVHEGHHQFTFVAGEPLRVTRAFDWEKVLSRQTIGGQPLFEIVPEQEEKPAQVRDLSQEERRQLKIEDVAKDNSRSADDMLADLRRGTAYLRGGEE